MGSWSLTRRRLKLSKRAGYGFSLLCPFCDGRTGVKDTEPSKDNTIYRRRECENGHRFRTVERFEPFDRSAHTKKVKPWRKRKNVQKTR